MSLPLFIESLVKDRNVASIMPTRTRCVERFLKSLELPPGSTVVEYGPGSGAFTGQLLETLDSDSKIFAFETNHLLANHLRSQFPDPRLEVLEQPAQSANSLLSSRSALSADLVLSGIPLSFLDGRAREALFTSTAELLRPGGTFLVYQSAWTPFQDDSQIINQLREHFSLKHREFFWLNIPPLVALHFTRRDHGLSNGP